MNGLPVEDGPARHRATSDAHSLANEPARDRAVRRDRAEKISVNPEDLSDIGVAESGGIFGDGF